MRWVKGHSGNLKGRPVRGAEKEIRAALHAAVAPAEVHRVLAERAKAGEPWAVTLYMAYDWGKPRETVEHSGVEGEPIRIEFVHDDLVSEIAGAETGSESDSSP